MSLIKLVGLVKAVKFQYYKIKKKINTKKKIN